MVLVFLGWLNIYAAVYNVEHQSILDVSQRYGKQLIWITAAIAIAVIMLIIDEKFYSFFAYVIYAFFILSLILVLIIGKEINGAKSWFSFGSVQIQPSEFAKIATALALARLMSTYNFKLYKREWFFRMLVIIALPAMLIALQPDMGSVLIYFAFIVVLFREGMSPVIPIVGIYLAILSILALVLDSFTVTLILIVGAVLILAVTNKRYTQIILAGLFFAAFFFGAKYLNTKLNAGYSAYIILMITLALALLVFFILSLRKKIRHGLLILGLFVVSLGITYSVDVVFNKVLEPHQQMRINVLLGIEEDPQGAGYNVRQSKIAIGSGGFSGKGFLQGTQTKYKFVPEQSTDFIFCTVGEEWGFMGTSLVILLFMLFLLRLIYLAERQKSTFNRVFGYGVLSIFLFHILINIGMTIGLFPVIGIPLPFFSYGGSSLWSFTALLFIFLRLDAGRIYTMR